MFNVTMWGCYVNSLRALSSLQATVTNFATNFLSSGLAGFFLFGEVLSPKVKKCLLSCKRPFSSISAYISYSEVYYVCTNCFTRLDVVSIMC